jgi:hypothetical protein
MQNPVRVAQPPITSQSVPPGGHPVSVRVASRKPNTLGTQEAAEKLASGTGKGRIVSGHDFSRADKGFKEAGF